MKTRVNKIGDMFFPQYKLLGLWENIYAYDDLGLPYPISFTKEIYAIEFLKLES